MRSIARALPNLSPLAIDHLEDFLSYFKSRLGITPDQAMEWENFADTLRANARNRQARIGEQDDAPGTIPERSEQGERIAALRLQELRQFNNAMLPLYRILTSEQRKIADELLIGATARR